MKLFLAALIFLAAIGTTWAAAVSDQDYIHYQVDIQTLLYKYSEDPTKLAAEMQAVNEKYKPDSKDWESYMDGLQKDPTRAIQLHQKIEEQLKKSGIQWGEQK